MNSQEENEIWRLIKRAEKHWQEDVNFYKHDKYKHPIDEPNFYDYLTEEIHNYAKQYARRNQQTGN